MDKNETTTPGSSFAPGPDNKRLTPFEPLVEQWFLNNLGRPTDIQEQAWPIIARGGHVLVAAPTGRGKTMAAFLWALNQLLFQKWSPGRTRVLYVSPLKALNNDIQRNLLAPLARLRRILEQETGAAPRINVQTRSGDTDQSERRRMLSHPPEILITTPESLNILLAGRGGRSLLTGLKVVILDEIHAVFPNKRGTHLITAVERLTDLSGEFQRIALSATIRPEEEAARFIGGFRSSGQGLGLIMTPRPVTVVKSRLAKIHHLRVSYPQAEGTGEKPDSAWEPLVREFKAIAQKNQSTLFFANSRRLAEKISHLINQGESQTLAYAHHGSLSKEIRRVVEAKLKAGELKAIVSTNSLEMGIDIGALDEVVLIQAPPSVSSARQRIGRAGHRVGEISRGSFFPSHPQDVLESAVLAGAVQNGEIETSRPVECPLDVLAQVIVGMCGLEPVPEEKLFERIKSSYPFRRLERDKFDLVLAMLAGRYAETRIRELKPRLAWDRIEGTVSARKGALLALYMSGGTIPDRGYFHLRHDRTNALIGELDEEFVWEARIGQTLTLGVQNWRIERITHNDVFAVPINSPALAPPFWHGEENGRDFHFSALIADFLEKADEALDTPDFIPWLIKDFFLDPEAARELVEYLTSQKRAVSAPLPHRRHILVEWINAGPGGVPGSQVVLHNFWGLKVNRPYALALEAAWRERFNQRPRLFVSNDSLSIILPDEIETAEILSLVSPANLEKNIRASLEGSGFFGARFRECAGRALLLTKPSLNQRLPLWMTRLKSQKLLEAASGYEDFPILLETWRACLQDEFDLDSLIMLLSELEAGLITWTEAHVDQPSPMARNSAWRQVNEFMYTRDDPLAAGPSALRRDLLQDVVFNPGLRPRVEPDAARRFEEKCRRLAPGYSPADARELVEWVKERLAIPRDEWKDLLAAMKRDHGPDAEAAATAAQEKLQVIGPPEDRPPLVVSLEHLDLFRLVWGTGPAGSEGAREEAVSRLASQWLQFYGPVSPEFIARTLGLDFSVLELTLEALAESHKIVIGQLLAGRDEALACDSRNLEIILRRSRAEKRPVFEPLPLTRLPLFLAAHQGLTLPQAETAPPREGLARCLEPLLGLPLPAGLWESDILPARLPGYKTAWLDGLFQETDLRWLGGEKKTVAFCFEADLDLPRESPEEGDDAGLEAAPAGPDDDLAQLFPDPAARYDFKALLQFGGGLSPSELSARLWEAAWRREVSSDSFAALRRGLGTDFKPPDEDFSDGPGARRRTLGKRAGFSQWKSRSPWGGAWFRLPRPEPLSDLLEQEELKKDRARLVLDRYGVVFKEILDREAGPFRWRELFRSLRLMELSGEIFSGFFFRGPSGPQFVSPGGLQKLRRKLPEKAVYWINALDPVSPCGLGLEDLKGVFPPRKASTHLVFRGEALVLVSERNGKSLTINLDPDDPDLLRCLAPLKNLLYRDFQPLGKIKIETINGEPAAAGPYVAALRLSLEATLDYKNVVLFKKFGA
ncbi:MAG: DEAD/DEAH box helicase [Pseudomonadota bacterium]